MPDVEDVDYEYHGDVVASESFKIQMSKFGVGFGYVRGWHSFASKELIDMEKPKAAGIIQSYKILKCAKLKSIVKQE
jgi:hypothetical protein